MRNSVIAFISIGVAFVSTGQLRDPCTNNSAPGNNALWKCTEKTKCKLAVTLPHQQTITCGNGRICCPRQLRLSEFQQANATALKKCYEYAKYRFNNYTRLSVLLGQPDQNVSILDCGHQETAVITVPDSFVIQKQFPHMALLGFEENVTDSKGWRCSGSLVSEQYILTAGHCSKSEKGDEVKWAALGIISISQISYDLRGKNLFRIVQRLNHPLYKAGSSDYKSHNIALLKLENPIRLSSSIRPICLHQPKQTLADSRAVISGWDHTIDEDSTDELVQNRVRVVDYEICSKRFKKDLRFQGNFDHNTTICSEPTNQHRYRCPNDSGGPMQIPVPGLDGCVLAQIGVTSQNRPLNCSETSLTTYARVSFYLPWIQKIVWR